jgi:hypothetical protein
MKKDRRERSIPAPNTAGAGRAWPGWRRVGLGRLGRCSVGSGARKIMRRAVASTCYEIEAWNAVREGGVGSTRYEREVWKVVLREAWGRKENHVGPYTGPYVRKTTSLSNNINEGS